MHWQGDGFIKTFFSYTLTTDVSSYEIWFINGTRQMKAAEKQQQQMKPHDQSCRLSSKYNTD